MKVLIIACTSIASDSRVLRQIAALKGNEIITCGSSDGNYDFYKTPPRNLWRKLKRFFWLITGQFEKFYWDDYRKELHKVLYREHYDAVIANDISTLPLAWAMKEFDNDVRANCKVYFDAHEYYPREWHLLKWKILYQRYATYLCKKYIPKADSFSTISHGIAEEYEKLIGIKPVIVSNATRYQDLQPSEISSPIKLIHHGAAIPGRKIEQMIKMMDYLDNHVLYLMLTAFDKKYLSYLKSFASKKVIFIPAVSEGEICKTINQFDVGVFLLPPITFNYRHALPNKIFEFIQARLAIVVSPNPEMAKIVKQYSLGIVAHDFTPESMAIAINQLKPDIIYFYKRNDAAKELSAENNYDLIRELVL